MLHSFLLSVRSAPGTWLRHVGLVTAVLLTTIIFSGCTQRLDAGLQVISEKTPASVYLDGEAQEGGTPFVNKSLKPGEYLLEIRPVDTAFVPYQAKISLKAGMLTVVNWRAGNRPESSGGVIFETEPLRDKKATELVITTIPDGGIITIDGQARGFAPVTAQNLTPGEHSFEVRLPSYETQTQKVNMLEGYRILVTAKLAKQTYQAATAATQVSPPATDLLSSATQSASASASPAALASPPLSPTPTTTSQSASEVAPPKVIVRPTGFTQEGREVLRVRDSASSSGKELGFAPVGSEYPYISSSQGWANIQFGTQSGWVSQQFVTIVEKE